MGIWLPDGRQTAVPRIVNVPAGLLGAEAVQVVWPVPSEPAPIINPMEAAAQTIALLTKIHVTLDAMALMSAVTMQLQLADTQARLQEAAKREAAAQEKLNEALKQQGKPPVHYGADGKRKGP